MTDQERNDGNLLIAEFMGAVRHHNGFWDGRTITMIFPDSKICISEQLQYDSDWGWIMPVLQKIEQIGLNTSVENNSCCIVWQGCENDYFYMLEKFQTIYTQHEEKLMAAWIAVIEFINWFNKNKRA